jgi:RNase P subunit RPR2
MANEVLAPSLDFLTDAAHLLARAAPETSAHLMTQRNALMFHNGMALSDAQRQHVCGSCGHIMIPGQESILKLEAEKTRRKRQSKSRIRKPGGAKPASKPTATPAGRLKNWVCGKCERYTKIRLPPAPRMVRRVRPVTTAGSSTAKSSFKAAPSLVDPPKASANASSKKRAKNRKQGLQALLQQSQSSSSKAGLGLSLTDFMKR